MKKEKKLTKIANQIAQLEKDLALGKNTEEIESKIQGLADSLSIEDMLFIDDYVMKKLLTK